MFDSSTSDAPSLFAMTSPEDDTLPVEAVQRPLQPDEQYATGPLERHPLNTLKLLTPNDYAALFDDICVIGQDEPAIVYLTIDS